METVYPVISTTWKASLAQDSADPIRLRVVDDLLRRRKLTGMTRDEIVAMLGEPPKTGYFRDFQLVYWLGPERGWMSIDSEWLAIRLGPGDRVSEAIVGHD